MKFAINYSTQAAVLFRSGLIRLDYFKCPDWPDLILEASQLLPVAVHFNLTAGNGRLAQTDWAKVERLLKQTATPYVSFHLEPSAEYFPGFSTGVLPPNQYEQVINSILADVELAAKYLGAERVILENVPYRNRAGKVLRPAVEPETIRYILEQTGAGLLLDISHARIAAHFLGIDEHEYLKRLPVESIKEMHFTGLHEFFGWKQDHLEVLPSDWPVFDWVLSQIRQGDWAEPWLLAFEYGGVGGKFAWRSDAQAMAQNIPRLYKSIADL